eukprot:Em0001g947a
MGDPDPNGEPAPFSPEQMAWLTRNLRPASVAGTGGTSSQLPPGSEFLVMIECSLFSIENPHRHRKLAPPRPLRPQPYSGHGGRASPPQAGIATAAPPAIRPGLRNICTTAIHLAARCYASYIRCRQHHSCASARIGGPTNRLPARLIARIKNLEFIEIYELLQEA